MLNSRIITVKRELMIWKKDQQEITILSHGEKRGTKIHKRHIRYMRHMRYMEKSHMQVIVVPIEAKENGTKAIFEEVVIQNFPKMMKHASSTINLMQDKFKEKHTYMYHGKIAKNQKERQKS